MNSYTLIDFVDRKETLEERTKLPLTKDILFVNGDVDIFDVIERS